MITQNQLKPVKWQIQIFIKQKTQVSVSTESHKRSTNGHKCKRQTYFISNQGNTWKDQRHYTQDGQTLQN